MSFCWPGPSSKRTGKPKASTTQWILVPNPPRERPRAWLERPPFYPGPCCLGLSTDHGGVDRQPLDIRIVRYGFEYSVDHALLDPAVIAPLGGLVRSKPFGQIAPATSRTRQPQQGIQKPPPVAARATLALAPARHKLAQPLPLIVAENLAFHTSLQKPVLNQNLSRLGIPKMSLQPRKFGRGCLKGPSL